LRRLNLEVEVYRQTTHLGNSLAVQTHHNAAKGLIAMLDVEVDLIETISIVSRSYRSRDQLITL
jgi:hypothetical protein